MPSCAPQTSVAGISTWPRHAPNCHIAPMQVTLATAGGKTEREMGWWPPRPVVLAAQLSRQHLCREEPGHLRGEGPCPPPKKHTRVHTQTPWGRQASAHCPHSVHMHTAGQCPAEPHELPLGSDLDGGLLRTLWPVLQAHLIAQGLALSGQCECRAWLSPPSAPPVPLTASQRWRPRELQHLRKQEMGGGACRWDWPPPQNCEEARPPLTQTQKP